MKREEYPRNAKMNLNSVVCDVLNKKSTRDESENWMNSDVFLGRKLIFENEDVSRTEFFRFRRKKTVKNDFIVERMN